MAKKKKEVRRLKHSGAIDPGEGKVRPHHKEIARRAKQSLKDRPTQQDGTSGNAYEHRHEIEKQMYVPRTANKYQTQPKKIDETAHCATYEWFEDNGHKDHMQLKRKNVPKEDERAPVTLTTITTEQYQNNYKEIFGERERGVSVEGGYKKFKKTYK